MDNIQFSVSVSCRSWAQTSKKKLHLVSTANIEKKKKFFFLIILCKKEKAKPKTFNFLLFYLKKKKNCFHKHKKSK